MGIDEKEKALAERLAQISRMEQEIKEREQAVRDKENARKQVLLRLPKSLWDDLAAWAEEDFRSINGQIEYLLSDAVKRHKGK